MFERQLQKSRDFARVPVILANIVLVYIYKCIVYAMRETPRAQIHEERASVRSTEKNYTSRRAKSLSPILFVFCFVIRAFFDRASESMIVRVRGK